MTRCLPLLVAATLCCLTLPSSARQGIPLDKQHIMPQLDGPATVYWDEWEIPHIYAETLHDAYFLQGYVHAQHRLFSMDFIRRFSGGRLAEVLGENFFGQNFLQEDIKARMEGFGRVAETNWQLLEPEYRAELQAYADGVNAYIEYLRTEAPQESPSEYALIGVTPADIDEWQPQDSLLLLAVQAVGHVLDMGDDLSQLRKTTKWLDEFNQPGTNDPRAGLYDLMFTVEPPVKVPSAFQWPDGSPFPGVPGPAPAPAPQVISASQRPQTHGLNMETVERTLAALEDRPAYHFGNRRQGNSNAWAVRGSMTTTGHPMLAADPHLALQMPSLFFQCHLNTVEAGGELQIAGVGLPGTPGIAIGFNRYLAWGLTNGQMDVTDTYVEQVVKGPDSEPAFVRHNGGLVAIERLTEIVKVKDGATVRDHQVTLLRVPHHGLMLRNSWDPDTNTLITFRNAGYEGTEEYKAFAEITFAESVDDFFQAMEFVTNGQAFVVADTSDNILFMSRYKLPIRSPQGLLPESPPWLPYDGTGGYEWQGFYPKERNIWQLNPDQNFVATSNQDPVGASFDGDALPGPGEIYLGDVWDIGYRNERIAELLSNSGGDRPAGEKIDLDFMKRVQGDTKSALGRIMVPKIIQIVIDDTTGLSAQFPEIPLAYGILLDWNGFETPAATDANATLQELRQSLATCVFNVWLTHFIPAAVADEYGAIGEGVFSSNGSTYGLRGLMKVWAMDDNDHILWDDLNTPERETEEILVLQSLIDAMQWLESELGPDPNDWRWGELHHVTLESILGLGGLNVPPNAAKGFPRPGDSYAIDSAGDWVRGTRYTYDDGPAYRLVVDLTPGAVKAYGSLPGGQSGRSNSSHYGDAAELWARNEYHPLYFQTADVLANATRRDEFSPDAFPTPTPSPSPTSTPTPGPPRAPAVAGYLGTDLATGQPGSLTLYAYSLEPLESMQITVGDLPVGLDLPANGDGSHSLTVPLEAPTAAGESLLSLQPVRGGLTGDLWPYLVVAP